MKNWILKCCLGLFSLSFIGAANVGWTEHSNSHCAKKIKSSEKCYLPSRSLCVEEDQLYVNFNNNFYLINSVATDGQGPYVLLDELVNSGMIARCAKGHPNPPWALVCMVCGLPLY